jgi:ketosteroid isomerase-like protein
MKPRTVAVAAAAGWLLAFSTAFAQSAAPDLREQVTTTERAFARTMATRDFKAFQTFLSTETVFFSGDHALRGPGEVAGVWKAYFEGPEAPFSWEPAQVEVLQSGTLALSSGPVRDPNGTQTGTFTSIWRLEDGGKWRIVFDKGCQACPSPRP